MITTKQDRCDFIGGSEANYIYLNYETESFKRWWRNKLEGINEDSFSNLYMAVGTILEHEVLDLYESIHGSTGERDGCRTKGIARANTDYFSGEMVSDVKVTKKAKEWNKKGKVPIQYRRQLIHYCYVLEIPYASIIAYQCDEELLNNPFEELTQDNLFEIEVGITDKEIQTHKRKVEYLEFCKEAGIYPVKEDEN